MAFNPAMKAPLHGPAVSSWAEDDSHMTEPNKLIHHEVPDHQPAAGGIAARARATASPQYLSGLNPEQREAVEGMPWLGTFHSIGGRILRFHAELVQLKSNFTVLDVDDQIRLLKQLLQAENIDDKRWPARMLAGLIDGWKNRGLMPSQVPRGEAAVFGNGKGGKLYASYQERLKILNAADFGDLLLENIRLFRGHPDVLRQYQNRFKFILVDEYQDTNVAQYLWLRLLAQAPAPLTSPRVRGEHSRPSADVLEEERH